MKKANYLAFVLIWMHVIHVFGQKPVMELTFTAQYQAQYVMLNSIYIENLTQGGDTMLYAGDTLLVLDYETGIPFNNALNEGCFRLSQNHPNPFAEQTVISIFLPQSDRLQLTVSNLLGQKVASYENSMVAGNHSFVFYPGDDKYYFLSASSNGLIKAIKMVNLNNHSGKSCSLSYQVPDKPQSGFKSTMDINDFGFSLGDLLRFTGFALNPWNISSSDVIEATPAGNENYVFDMSEGIPCPGLPAIVYEGQTYNTVQIGTQCWFRENLNVGMLLNGFYEQSNNGITEKYCYDNNTSNCDVYGGLYLWDEAMQYTTQPETQGICPSGWHIPSDEEVCTLTLFIDGTVDCIATVSSGFDVGTKMKSTTLWYGNGNGTNASGFNALPSGFRYPYQNVFNSSTSTAIHWSSTELEWGFGVWCRNLDYANTGIMRSAYEKAYGFSVRCLKD